jgi:hypothetical protein
MWRLIGAFLLVLLIIMASYLAIFLGGLLVGIVARLAASAAIAIMVTSVTMILLFCAFAYGVVRLTFLLTPVVISERKIGIGRSWALGKGNFWRMFAIMLVMLLPFMVVELVAFGWLLGGLPAINPSAPPAATTAAIMAWEMGMFQRMLSFWYIVFPVSAIFSVLFYGSFIGAQCFAYRALAPKENSAEIFS